MSNILEDMLCEIVARNCDNISGYFPDKELFEQYKSESIEDAKRISYVYINGLQDYE